MFNFGNVIPHWINRFLLCKMTGNFVGFL